MKRWNTKQDKVLLGSLMLLLVANYGPSLRLGLNQVKTQSVDLSATIAEPPITEEIEDGRFKVTLSQAEQSDKTTAIITPAEITEATICQADCKLELSISMPYQGRNNSLEILKAVKNDHEFVELMEKMKPQKTTNKVNNDGKIVTKKSEKQNSEKTNNDDTKVEEIADTKNPILSLCRDQQNHKKGTAAYLDCALTKLGKLAAKEDNAGRPVYKSMALLKLFKSEIKKGMMERLTDTDDADARKQAFDDLGELFETMEVENGKLVRKEISQLKLDAHYRDAMKIAEIDQIIKSIPNNNPKKMVLMNELALKRAEFTNLLNDQAFASGLDYSNLMDLDGSNRNNAILEYYKNYAAEASGLQKAVWSNDPAQALAQMKQDFSGYSVDDNSNQNNNGGSDNGSRGGGNRGNRSGSNGRALPNGAGSFDSGFNSNNPNSQFGGRGGRGGQGNLNNRQFYPQSNFQNQNYNYGNNYGNNYGSLAATPNNYNYNYNPNGNFYGNNGFRNSNLAAVPNQMGNRFGGGYQYQNQFNNNQFQQPFYGQQGFNNGPYGNGMNNYNGMVPLNNMGSGARPRY